MKTLRFVITAVLALSGSMMADTLMSSTGSFSAFPSGFASSTPGWTGNTQAPYQSGDAFWNNTSAKVGQGGSHDMNIGYLLSDSGGYAGTNSVLGSDSVSSYLANSDGSDPAAWDFLSSGALYDATLLFASSVMATGNAANGITFGYYSGNTYTPLYVPSTTSSPTGTQFVDPTTAGNTFGFYATICYANGCETYTSGNGNSGSVNGAAGWNHLALFQTANGSYVIALEDTANYGLEGLGDFSDTVVEFAALPEPATFGITALGLALLIYLTRA